MATPPSTAELLALLGERGLAATTQRLALLSALLSVDEGMYRPRTVTGSSRTGSRR